MDCGLEYALQECGVVGIWGLQSPALNPTLKLGEYRVVCLLYALQVPHHSRLHPLRSYSTDSSCMVYSSVDSTAGARAPRVQFLNNSVWWGHARSQCVLVLPYGGLTGGAAATLLPFPFTALAVS